MNKLSYF